MNDTASVPTGFSIELRGSTRLYGILGHPVAQAKAPQVLTPRLQQAGIDAACVPFDVAPADLAGTVQALRAVGNLHGFIVTIPHKAAVLPLVQSMSERSRRSGVANVVRREADGRWHADILDGEAFVRGLQQQGHAVPGRHVAMAGAGGAGAALAWALFDAGAASLALRDIDAMRASALAARLVAEGHAARAVTTFEALDQPCSLLVNASPAGMGEDRSQPFPAAMLAPGVVAADIVMQPRDTAFLQAALAAGCAIHHGHHLLDAQLGLFDAFFDFARLAGADR